MDSDHYSTLLLSIPYPISVHGATFSTLPFTKRALLPHNTGSPSEERRQRWMGLWHYTGQLQLQSARHGHSQALVDLNENILRDIEEFFKPGAYITQLKATERHHWRLFIRSHVVSSGATKGFTLLFSYM